MPTSQSSLSILLARINDTQVGFSARAVHEIVRAVAITPVSGAPRIIEGAINLHGRVIPVVDVRQRLSLAPAPNSPEQYLVALELSDRLVAVRVDDVEDVTEIDHSALESPTTLSPVLQGLHGIAPTAQGAIVIYDIDAFLTQAERDALDGTELAVR